jgi:steroid delta-isomerase-like uncharacterized protein
MAETTTKPKAATGRKKGAKALARAYFEALAAHDLDAATALWRPGSKDHLHGLAELRAPDDVRRYFEDIFNAIPDWEFEILDIAAAGNRAAVRWRVKGTFSGPGRFQGLAPTGAKFEIEGCDMLAVEDGEIVGNDAYLNGAELAQQLGVLPPQGSMGERAMTAAVNARTAAADRLRRLRDRN